MWQGFVPRLRRLLTKMLRTSDHFRSDIADILDLLEELDLRMCSTKIGPNARRASSDRSIIRFQPKRYTIEQRQRGMFLCEYRIDGRPQPFCCPLEIYEVIANILETTDDFTHFAEIQRGVAEQIGNTPPDYLIRLSLRFWLSIDPPIVQKDRSRYRACVRGKFINAARRAWRDLEKQGDG